MLDTYANLSQNSSDLINLPTIVDAISKAGGITPKSNIKSVSVKKIKTI